MTELEFDDRADIIEKYQRDHKLRNQGAETGVGTPPYLDAVLLADQLMPIHAAAIQLGRALQLDGKSLDELEELAAQLGVPLQGATGSNGYVTVRTSTGGSSILSGDELTDQVTGLRFRCTQTKLYTNGEDVPVAAIDTGPTTNLDAETVLQWTAPRPGCSPTCTVMEQTNGDGLSGGADAEGREQIIAKIIDRLSNPAASGNVADYRATIKETPGVQIEEAFCYPAIYGPGTIGWTITVAPNKYGSRLPSTAVSTLVRDYIFGQMPKSDLQFYLDPTAQTVDVVAKVTWAESAAQWLNETPWPAYFEESPGSGSGAVQVGTVTSATYFQLVTANADYSTCGDISAGIVFAIWDPTQRKFIRKTALSVSGTGPWMVTIDTSYDASDATYTPTTGQRVMPWSDSLDSLVAAAIAYFDGVGPGPITHAVLDGRRGERDPSSPTYWPYQVTKALDVSLLTLDAVASGEVVEGSGTVATTHASSPRLLQLDELAVFPE